MSTADEDLARVTVISPTRRVDLALPGAVTLGELLPSIVRFSGHEAGTPQEAVHGWVLQRFGDDPLDPNALISKLTIRDGETLYLRQRDNAMPDAAFDDVVDAVSSTTMKRPSWLPRHSQTFTIVVLGIVLTLLPLAVMVMQMSTTAIGKRGYWGATIDLVLALGAAIAAIALSRAAGKYEVSAALAWSAVALAGMGGYQLVDVPDLSVRFVLASALMLIMATSCALAAGVTTMGLFAAATTSGLVLIASVIAALVHNSAVEASAIGVAVLLAATVYLPSLSYRLAQIQLPALPTTSEAILSDDEPVQSDIVQRAMLADRILAALLAAACVAMVLFSGVLLWHGNWWRVGLAAAVGIALLMRARAFVGRAQRAALLIGGVAIVLPAALTGLMLLELVPALQMALLIPLIAVVAVALTHYASVGYAKISSPTAGRFGDILEWLSVMSVVPLALGVLGTYGWIQTMFTA